MVQEALRCLRMVIISDNPSCSIFGMNQTRLHRLLTVGLLALVSLLPVACIPGGSNLGGSSSGAGGDSEGGAFYLETVEWGRLVDVVDRDGQLVQTDVVIRAELSLAGDYSLSNNPVTEAEVLTILNYAQVDAGFDSLFTSATSGLDGILTKGPSDNQPYTMIPRNAAMKLTFSAPLAQSSEEVTQEMVQFYMGTDYSSPFLGRFSVQESVDGSMGILIFDPTISARQSTELILPSWRELAGAVGTIRSDRQVEGLIGIRGAVTIQAHHPPQNSRVTQNEKGSLYCLSGTRVSSSHIPCNCSGT